MRREHHACDRDDATHARRDASGEARDEAGRGCGRARHQRANPKTETKERAPGGDHNVADTEGRGPKTRDDEEDGKDACRGRGAQAPPARSARGTHVPVDPELGGDLCDHLDWEVRSETRKRKGVQHQLEVNSDTSHRSI